MICISHLFFFQLCDMESHCVIHIQILFKSVALHLHVKLRIWRQVTCILIRGTTFIGVRADIANNKWDRVLIIVMEGVFYIVPHNIECECFYSHVMKLVSFSTLLLSAQGMIMLSSNRGTQSWCHFLGQNYPQDGGSFNTKHPIIFAAREKNNNKSIYK